ncbi:hypothetical protein QJQ45_007537 [Haematococcus lacustris]|nr:hypothetical protein QJQ45_007537 [Haematococcus lacustris]
MQSRLWAHIAAVCNFDIGKCSPFESAALRRASGEPVAMMAVAVREKLVVTKPLLFGEWVIGSGCSRHLTPHRELLHDYRPLHEPHHIIVANGGRIEAQGQGVHSVRGTQVEQDLFLLDSKPVPVAGGFSLAARTCSDPLVLHHRLGHPGYRQLARLLREGMGAGHLSHRRPIDVCDVTGQYSAATPDGMRYFVSLHDEFSGLLAVVLIKHKSDAPSALRDMGGGYIGAETQQWLRGEGITHQQTAPRTPTMNGSAERVNRTVMECVRAMMLASFWAFGVMAAAHVHNLRSVAGKPCTPHEACYGSPPDIHHLRVWGCPAWVHDSEPSSKLASRGMKGVFVGYEEGGKAYQVWAEGRLKRGLCRASSPAPLRSRVVRACSQRPAQTVAGEAATATAAVGDKRAVGVDTLLLQIVQRRHFERVRNCVEFPDFVTLCYSARYGSNNGSGSERDGRWVLKVKRGSDGSIVKYKARWVVKGFRQRDGVDYFEDVVFAPVVMHPRAWYLCLREQLEQIGETQPTPAPGRPS